VQAPERDAFVVITLYLLSTQDLGRAPPSDCAGLPANVPLHALFVTQIAMTS
jgi:hypothetical protein